MKTLKTKLNSLRSNLSLSQNKRIDFLTDSNNNADCPFFNELGMLATLLIEYGALSLRTLLALKRDYEKRNPYIDAFAITSNREFGESYVQRHLFNNVPEIKPASLEHDCYYKNDYNFILNSIKISFGASRAVTKQKQMQLMQKALPYESTKFFDMNFQHLRPYTCHVFVWMGVWTNRISYWVLSRNELLCNPYFNYKQAQGNDGEGQLHINAANLCEFRCFETDDDGLVRRIKIAHRRQITSDKNMSKTKHVGKRRHSHNFISVKDRLIRREE